MAHLTKPTTYNIEDSNIALLGSDLEKHIREESADTEVAWDKAGIAPGLQIWRIEKFHVVAWPKERYGSFYDGDSYIILHTYHKTPDVLSYDLHFWLGQNTTQDEAGTAAYKAVELDDHLHGIPVQYRESQGHESDRFIAYFTEFVCQNGGISTGFHHVSAPPPLDLHRLFRITFTRPALSSGKKTSLVVRQVPAEAASLVAGDAYVLDKGSKIMQLNTKASAPQEKFKAAEFVRKLVDLRMGQCELEVYDESGPGFGVFLAEFGQGASIRSDMKVVDASAKLFCLSDASGSVTFQPAGSPSTSDAFILDTVVTIYVWIGKGASLNERRLAGQYAQKYLYEKGRGSVAVPIIKMNEGDETSEFLEGLKLL